MKLNIKRAILFTSLATAVFACKKADLDAIETTDVVGHISVVHASPGTPSLAVFVDTIRRPLLTTPAYGANTGYLGLDLGNRWFQVRRADSLAHVIVDRTGLPIEYQKDYTMFVYDTLNVVSLPPANFRLSGTARSVVLEDDLSLPPTGSTKLRFIHAAPNAPSVDVTFVRLVSGVPTDSITFTNRSYLGATPNASTLAPFSTVIGSATYSVRLKVPGTQTLVVSPISITTLPANRIVTVFATGTARGAGLAIGSFRHF